MSSNAPLAVFELLSLILCASSSYTRPSAPLKGYKKFQRKELLTMIRCHLTKCNGDVSFITTFLRVNPLTCLRKTDSRTANYFHMRMDQRRRDNGRKESPYSGEDDVKFLELIDLTLATCTVEYTHLHQITK